jgi:molecular chaperone GrpE (heat shock protein)
LEDQVIAEHARGYRMGNRLLRAAQVKVGRSLDKVREAAE